MARYGLRLILLLLIAAPVAGCADLGGDQWVAGYPGYCQLPAYAIDPNCAGIDNTSIYGFSPQHGGNRGNGGHR